MSPTVETLKETSGVGLGYVWHYVLLLLFVGSLFAVCVAWACVVLIGVPFFDAVAVLAALVATIILIFLLSSAYNVSTWLSGGIAEMLAWSKKERKKALPPLPTASSLPAETFKLSENGQQGRDVVKEYVNGFDPRDLDYLARYLARGGHTSEAAMKDMILYHEDVKLGDLKEGTHLTRFLDLCEQKTILSARDGVRRKPGKLLIDDEKEIARRLKLKEEAGKV